MFSEAASFLTATFQRNEYMDVVKIQCIVFGHLWTLTPSLTLWLQSMVFLLKYVYCSKIT